MKEKTIFTETFPINTQAIPPLSSYRLKISGNADIATIGGKLSYRLRTNLGGHWVWTSNHLLTDYSDPDIDNKIETEIQKLWTAQPDIFGHLKKIEQHQWSPTPQAQADFVAKGLVPDLHKKIQNILSKDSTDIGNARIERVYSVRGWVVDNSPALSISISSRLIYKQDLNTYIRSKRDTNIKELITGLWVAEKAGTLKGQVIDISGTLKEEREQLLHLTQREEMQNLIKNAPDDELVIWVLSGRNQYKYIASALRIILKTEYIKRFNINSKTALNALRIEPKIRTELIKPISELIKKKDYITQSYNSSKNNTLFSSIPIPKLRFANGTPENFDNQKLLYYLKEYGIVKKSENLKDNNIKMGIVNTLSNKKYSGLIDRLKQNMSEIGFTLSIIGEQHINKISRSSLEDAVNKLEEKNPDILLGLLPAKYDDDEDSGGIYYVFKSLTVGRGIPSQVVNSYTLDNTFATGNIILGILGKTGNIPYVLDKRLDYTDFIVGLDIARERKKRLPGSINATAITRIYCNDGQFLHYTIYDAPLEGETIPKNVLQALLPQKDFKGKRVVIHRDGFFRGQEIESLQSWAKEINAVFYPVEIIKSGTPRLYKIQDQNIQKPDKGDIFKLSDTEAFIVSSPPPYGNYTPQTLRIRTQKPFDIGRAVDSVLALTMLHYGSLLPPRLPATIHYSDRIAYLTLRGIKPKNLEGSIPYWL